MSESVIMLNNLPPEILGVICDKLSGRGESAGYELFKSCKQIHSALLNHAMQSATTITIPIKLGVDWSPVPVSRPGNVVYSFGQFGIDPVCESIRLHKVIHTILGELTNPNRRHSISFDFGVEIEIPLELFDGCRFLKLKGSSYKIPKFDNVHGLILQDPIASYTDINVPVLDLGTSNTHMNVHNWKLPSDSVITSPHVAFTCFCELTIGTAPNMTSGFTFSSYDPEFINIPPNAYGARKFIGYANMVEKFRRLESASVAGCADEDLRLFNLRSFPPIVVPSADIRLPDVQYSILTTLELGGQIGDLGVLNGSGVTSLDITCCDNITSIYPNNRLTTLRCTALIEDFSNLTSLKSLYIQYPYGLEHTAHAHLTNALAVLPNLQHLAIEDAELEEIDLSVPEISLDGVSSPMLTTSSSEIKLKYCDIKMIVATAECSMHLMTNDARNTSDPDSKMEIIMPNVKSFTCTASIFALQQPPMTAIQHLDIADVFVCDMYSRFEHLVTLKCQSIRDSTSSVCKIDSRFPKLEHLAIKLQVQTVAINNPLKTCGIRCNRDRQPVIITFDANCEKVETLHTHDILKANIGTYISTSPLYHMIGPNVKIGKLVLELNPTWLREGVCFDTVFQYIVRYVNYTVLGFQNTTVTPAFSIVFREPVLYFDKCVFVYRKRTFHGATTKKVLVHDCKFKDWKADTLPVYSAISGLRFTPE